MVSRDLTQLQVGNRAPEAAELFSRVWTEVPGETAPKMGVALAAERAGQIPRAHQIYDWISRSDAGFVSAAFGLARCNISIAKVSEAVAAFDRVPSSSAAHYDAQVAAARTLASSTGSQHPSVDDLATASSIIDRLELDAAERASISAEIYEQALVGLGAGRIKHGSVELLGRPATEDDLRRGLEETYRIQARLTADESVRIELLDKANSIRPWSLF